MQAGSEHDHPLRRSLLLMLLWIVLCSSGATTAETLNEVLNPRKTDNGWVSDMADVLDSATEQRLNGLCNWLEQKTTAELAVVTVRRTEGLTPKEFATGLFERWGIGKSDQDNGVLVLLVTEMRRIEIETGYGVEGVLPDGKIGAILDTQVIPSFRAGDFGGGLAAGIEAMVTVIAAEKPPLYLMSPTTPTSKTSFPVSFGLTQFLLLTAVAIVALLIVARFYIRYCPQCHKRMRRLTEEQDDAYLSTAQRFEEELGSVDYRVWRCDECLICQVEPKPGRYSCLYERCPVCGHRTVYVKSATLQEPTYERHGLAQIKRVCRFPKCTYQRTEQLTTPKLIRAPVRVRRSTRDWPSANRGSGGGNIGGGGFGGGSFGGGSSGGGGAGRSW